jgi:hypothetical protein
MNFQRRRNRKILLKKIHFDFKIYKRKPQLINCKDSNDYEMCGIVQL